MEHPSNQIETSIQDEYHLTSCLGSIRVDKFNEIHLDWNGQSYLMEVPNLFLQPGSLVKHCHMYYTGDIQVVYGRYTGTDGIRVEKSGIYRDIRGYTRGIRVVYGWYTGGIQGIYEDIRGYTQYIVLPI